MVRAPNSPKVLVLVLHPWAKSGSEIQHRTKKHKLSTFPSSRDRRKWSSWITTGAPFMASAARQFSMSWPNNWTKWLTMCSGGELWAFMIKFYTKKSTLRSKIMKWCSASVRFSTLCLIKFKRRMKLHLRVMARSLICSNCRWQVKAVRSATLSKRQSWNSCCFVTGLYLTPFKTRLTWLRNWT